MNIKWIDASKKKPPRDHGNRDLSVSVLISDGKNIGIGYFEFETEDSSEVWWDESHRLRELVGGWADVKYWAILPIFFL